MVVPDKKNQTKKKQHVHFEHVCMLMLAFSFMHCCAYVQPHRTISVTEDLVLFL